MLKCKLHTDEYLDFKDDKSQKRSRGKRERNARNIGFELISHFHQHVSEDIW